jgi:hypothetical protein
MDNDQLAYELDMLAQKVRALEGLMRERSAELGHVTNDLAGTNSRIDALERRLNLLMLNVDKIADILARVTAHMRGPE